MLDLQKRYGFFSILKGLFLLLLAGYIIFFALNPKYVMERVVGLQKEQHSQMVMSRIAIDQECRVVLEKMLNDAKADRAWLIEFHNGNKNLSTDLPFLFGSMRIEETGDTIMNVDEEYADFSLSKYNLVLKTIQDGYYYGGIEEIKNIDKRIYYKFKSNDINEIALLTIYKGESPIGIVGLSFCFDNVMDKKLAGKVIRSSGMQIGTLLSQVQEE